MIVEGLFSEDLLPLAKKFQKISKIVLRAAQIHRRFIAGC
jgi:hypothetical protein